MSYSKIREVLSKKISTTVEGHEINTKKGLLFKQELCTECKTMKGTKVIKLTDKYGCLLP